MSFPNGAESPEVMTLPALLLLLVIDHLQGRGIKLVQSAAAALAAIPAFEHENLVASQVAWAALSAWLFIVLLLPSSNPLPMFSCPDSCRQHI